MFCCSHFALMAKSPPREWERILHTTSLIVATMPLLTRLYVLEIDDSCVCACVCLLLIEAKGGPAPLWILLNVNSFKNQLPRRTHLLYTFISLCVCVCNWPRPGHSKSSTNIKTLFSLFFNFSLFWTFSFFFYKTCTLGWSSKTRPGTQNVGLGYSLIGTTRGASLSLSLSLIFSAESRFICFKRPKFRLPFFSLH